MSFRIRSWTKNGIDLQSGTKHFYLQPFFFKSISALNWRFFCLGLESCWWDIESSYTSQCKKNVFSTSYKLHFCVYDSKYERRMCKLNLNCAWKLAVWSSIVWRFWSSLFQDFTWYVHSSWSSLKQVLLPWAGKTVHRNCCAPRNGKRCRTQTSCALSHPLVSVTTPESYSVCWIVESSPRSATM